MDVLRFENTTVYAPSGEKPLPRIWHTFFPAKGGGNGRDTLLKNVTFALRDGECTAVMGETEAVTAFLQAAADDRADVHRSGRVLTAFGAGEELAEALSARDNARLFCVLADVPWIERTARVEEILHMSGLMAQADRPISALPPQMRAQLRVSCVLTVPPDVLIENGALRLCTMPFAQAALHKIRRETGKHMAFLCAQDEVVGRVCRRAVLLRGKKLVRQGDYALMRYGQTAVRRMEAAFSAPLDLPDLTRLRLTMAQTLRETQAMLLRTRDD